MSRDNEEQQTSTKPRRQRRATRPPARFVAALISGATDVAMAEEFGVDRVTVAKWAKLPEIVEACARAEREITEDEIQRQRRSFRKLVGTAIGVTGAVLTGSVSVTCPCGCGHTFDVEVPTRPSDQLRAVEIVLDRSPGFSKREIHELDGGVRVTPVPIDLANLSPEQLAAMAGAPAPIEGPPPPLVEPETEG